jgi:16S rRNA (guanine1207-N2)-methyltransferase
VSRPSRDEAAAALVVAALRGEALEGPALVLEDPRSDVVEALTAAAVPIRQWSRRHADPAWPPCDGSCSWVGMRLPRARAEFDMLLHMAAGALAEGGELWVYGANDEGVRSVRRRLDPFFGPAETLATGGHARLVAARRVPGADAVRCGWEAWVETNRLDLPWGEVAWRSYPGTFAHGRLDEGTALLLGHLPGAGPAARVLDYGTGSGFLAAGMRAAAPDAVIVGLEPDGLAARAARANVPGLEVVVGGGWEPLAEREPWDVVVANPPYHRGKAETLEEVDRFLAGLAIRLAPGGVARCVVQRRFPLEERARVAGLAAARPIADAGPYRVWELRRGAR